jgi:hypothetical protein
LTSHICAPIVTALVLASGSVGNDAASYGPGPRASGSCPSTDRGDLLGASHPADRMQAAQLFLDPRGQCWCLPAKERLVGLGGDRAQRCVRGHAAAAPDRRGQPDAVPVASEQSLAQFGFLAVRSSVAARHLRLRMLVAPIPA